ncbi:MAG: SusC/RagA family TonB-linked outer membrane protein [Sphingobacterium sp.]
MMKYQSFQRILFIWLCLLLPSLGVQGQEDTPVFKGRVLDEYNRPLQDVTVTSLDGKRGTSSSANGAFQLEASLINDAWRLEKKGFASQTIVFGENTDTLTVQLVRDVHRLDQPIDLGYSMTNQRNLTGAVSVVSGQALERHPVANLSQTFAGRFSGLTTEETFSELSRANTDLFVRGLSAARKGGPLVVIDGIPTSYNSNQSLEYISPNEIESIAILKDASTQALYGIQGANGVIVVRTKRGKKGPVEIQVRLDQSLQQVTTKPFMYSSLDYAEMMNQAGVNDGLGAFSQFSEPAVDYFRTGERPDLYPNNNWHQRYMKDVASMQRVGVNVNGGNDKITYFSNLNFMHQGGYFNTESPDYNANPKNIWVNYRSNVDVQFNKYLSGFLRLGGNVKRERTPGAASNEETYSSMFLLPPTTYGPLTPEILDPTSGEVLVPEGQVVVTDRVDKPTYGILNRSGYINHTVTNISSQFGLDLDMSFLTQGLQLSGVFAYQTNSVGSLTTTQDFERYQRANDFDKLEFSRKGEQQNTPLAYGKSHSYYYHLTYKGQLNYSRSFGAHRVNGMAYGLFQNLTKANTDAPALLPYKRLNTGIQMEYNYDDRYILKGVFGYSGSEQYARNHRYLYTPALAGSWLVSNESFMEQTQSWLSLLKIRGSWGKTANDQSELQRYAYLDEIVVNRGGPLGYLQYLVVENQTGNPYIAAEVSTKSNLGIDVGLFNQFTVTADFYKERMENMVVGAVATVPAYQGVPLANYPKINEGIFENQGFEISLRYDQQINARSSFYLQGMYSHNKNTIIRWNEPTRTEGFAYQKREEGYSYGQQFGYLVDYEGGNGFFNTQEEIDASGLQYGFGAIRVGDLKYRDLNEDGRIDERDQGPIGDGAIPRRVYSFAGGFKYGNFDMHVLFQGVGQYASIMTGAGIWETHNGGMFTALHQKAWTEDRFAAGEEISWPALSTEKSVNHEASDFVNFNRSYLRLKNLEMSYSLQSDGLKRWGVDGLRFILSGQNLLTWDKMKSKDFGPEGAGYLSFPVYRVFSFGLGLTL